MTSMDLLELLGSVRDGYVVQAGEKPARVRSLRSRRFLLIAAMIALALLLVGCTVAYARGWFADFFSARGEMPLTPEQIEFIEENEQIIQQTQAKDGWTVELKSAITDGETGYILFGITAPEDIDLEGYHAGSHDTAYITPGNNSWNRHPSRALVVASTGFADEEKNFIWQGGGGKGGWQEDHDGRSNTLDYLIGTRCEKLYPDREMLLTEPFGPEVEFTVTFDGFTLEYEDPEVRRAIDEKYAGMTDYMVEQEDLVGLHKTDVLTEEQWQFTVAFDVVEARSVELISQPTKTWAQVTWKLDDEPLFYQTGTGIAPVTITSFVLNAFGANLTYEYEEPAINAFIEYRNSFGFEDRCVYAVMKDGSRIALHTDGTGDKLTAETPLVLSEVDYILLGDGVQLPVP